MSDQIGAVGVGNTESAEDRAALKEFTQLIGKMKTESPAAWNAFKNQLTQMKDSVLQASGVSGMVSQVQQTMMLPQQIFQDRLMFELEKSFTPLTNDLRYRISSITAQIQDQLAQNAIGAGIGGVIGGILGTIVGHPFIGTAIGTAAGSNIQQMARMGFIDYYQQQFQQGTILQQLTGTAPGSPKWRGGADSDKPSDTAQKVYDYNQAYNQQNPGAGVGSGGAPVTTGYSNGASYTNFQAYHLSSSTLQQFGA